MNRNIIGCHHRCWLKNIHPFTEYNRYNAYADCTPLDVMVRQIEEYRIARNGEIEILRYQDDYYVKYIEIELDEDE